LYKAQIVKGLDFPLKGNTVAGGLDLGQNNVSHPAAVIKVNRIPAVQMSRQKLYLLRRNRFSVQRRNLLDKPRPVGVQLLDFAVGIGQQNRISPGQGIQQFSISFSTWASSTFKAVSLGLTVVALAVRV
jgi:hypothetical protein